MSSPVAALSTALTSTRRQLFDPFDATRYAALAFTVWLAHFGSAGGLSPGLRGSPNVPAGPAGPIEAPDAAKVQEVAAQLAPWLPTIAAGVAVAALLGFLFGAVVLWLQSRGTFLVIDNLAHGRAAIGAPWREQAQPANALFRFRLLVNFTGGLVALLTAAFVAWAVWGSVLTGTVDPARIGMAIAGGVLAGGFLVVVGITDACATEFVAPLMYVRRGSTWSGFRDLGALVMREPGSFVLYLLLRLAVAIAAGLAMVLGTVLTCGLAMLPFVGTLVLLPVFVYERMYALHFMAGLADDLRPLALIAPEPSAPSHPAGEPLPAR